MTVKLLDYAGNATEVELEDIDDIARMSIKVLTGDEVLTVIYKDYTVDTFDSSGTRIIDCFDGEYEIYNEADGVNFFDDEAFVNRKSSYWFYKCDD